ncbi:large proline-rich protein BAG6 isoform X9 [Drosophila erecta]|nr:large proline-rich protein BAG6 isoform X9 [Drosophila erecta]XP_026836415.1 large proline-rich protein BAG6 isoform X9 [Drosophila erecta]
MRMCNLTTPTAAAAGMPLPQSPLGEPGPIGIAALPAPPYSETDPHAAPAGGATVIAMESMEPSTSRAAQIPPSSSGSGPPAPLPTTTV